LNQWVALSAVVGGAIVLAFMRRHPIPEPVIAQDPVELDLYDVPPEKDTDSDTEADEGSDSDSDVVSDTSSDSRAQSDPDVDVDTSGV
jgi:hypothetical protein